MGSIHLVFVYLATPRSGPHFLEKAEISAFVWKTAHWNSEYVRRRLLALCGYKVDDVTIAGRHHFL